MRDTLRDTRKERKDAQRITKSDIMSDIFFNSGVNSLSNLTYLSVLFHVRVNPLEIRELLTVPGRYYQIFIDMGWIYPIIGDRNCDSEKVPMSLKAWFTLFPSIRSGSVGEGRVKRDRTVPDKERECKDLWLTFRIRITFPGRYRRNPNTNPYIT